MHILVWFKNCLNNFQYFSEISSCAEHDVRDKNYEKLFINVSFFWYGDIIEGDDIYSISGKKFKCKVKNESNDHKAP